MILFNKAVERCVCARPNRFEPHRRAFSRLYFTNLMYVFAIVSFKYCLLTHLTYIPFVLVEFQVKIRFKNRVRRPKCKHIHTESKFARREVVYLSFKTSEL